MADFTNFCCRSGGNNLNAGTVDGSTTEPATAPLVTYTAGNWDATTDIYTAPSGANMTEAVVGRFASLYVDGDTSPTANQFLIARITAVNAGTRQITLSTTARTLLGTEVATGTGNRSLRIGGAWAGMSGASGFPLTFLTAALTDATGNPNRINFKADGTYSCSATMAAPSGGCVHLAGYSSSYGDLESSGTPVPISGATAGAAYTLFTPNGSNGTMVGLEWKNNGATGGSSTIYGVNWSGDSGWTVRRCVFRDFRSVGARYSVTGSASGMTFVECEWYGCNQSNTASIGAVLLAGQAEFIRCHFHDNAGSNTAAIRAGAPARAVGCVFDSNGGPGLNVASANGCSVTGCDFYANGGGGVVTNTTMYIENSNFIDNTGYGVNNTAGVTTLVNCGFGSGTMANTSGDVASAALAVQIGSVTYAADVTPWTDPANGDFRVSLAAAKAAGRGAFLQTASGYSGSVAYPDIGAGQSSGGAGSGSGRLHMGI